MTLNEISTPCLKRCISWRFIIIKWRSVTKHPSHVSHTGYVPRQNIFLNNDADSKMTNMLVTLDTFQDRTLLLNDDTQSNIPTMLKTWDTSSDVLLLNSDTAKKHIHHICHNDTRAYKWLLVTTLPYFCFPHWFIILIEILISNSSNM